MLSLIFPAVCLGCRRLLIHGSRSALCSLCDLEHAPLPPDERRVDGIESLFAYQGPLVRALTGLKFSGNTAVAGPLGHLMATAPILQETPGWDLVVPVPLHPQRTWWRGYNQALLLARWMLRHASRELRSSAPRLSPQLLRRIRPTPPQRQLSAKRRAANVLGAFRVQRDASITQKRILVIDDVTTTGSTLTSCMEALRAAGAGHVAGLTLMRTLECGDDR